MLLLLGGFISAFLSCPNLYRRNESSLVAPSLFKQFTLPVVYCLLNLLTLPEWEDTLVYGGFRPAFQEESEIFAYWRTGAASGKRILVLCHYGRGTVSVPFEEPFRVLLNNSDGLESREGRLWLHTYQVVALGCGAGEEEEL